MMFRVDRASGSGECPTRGAVMRNTTVVYAYDPTKTDLERVKALHAFATDGRTIRDVDGGIEVRIPSKAWFVDIPDLAGLMNFVKREGRIIIDRYPGERHPSLTIYDDYVE